MTNALSQISIADASLESLVALFHVSSSAEARLTFLKSQLCEYAEAIHILQ